MGSCTNESNDKHKKIIQENQVRESTKLNNISQNLRESNNKGMIQEPSKNPINENYYLI